MTAVEKKATLAMVLGLVGLAAWLLPIAGAPITICGLVLAIKSLHSLRKNQALIGLVCSILGLFATVVNAILGMYLGAMGLL
jgi:hypothetical protein